MDPLTLSVLSLGGTALSGLGKAFGAITSGNQQAEMDQYQSQHLADAAEFGKAQAAQTDMVMRQNLQQTLAQMMSTRASANTSPDSPTGAAIEARTQGQGDQQRAIQVGNILGQVGEDETASALYAKAGSQTIFDSYLNAAAGIGGSALSAMSGLKFS